MEARRLVSEREDEGALRWRRDLFRGFRYRKEAGRVARVILNGSGDDSEAVFLCRLFTRYRCGAWIVELLHMRGSACGIGKDNWRYGWMSL